MYWKRVTDVKMRRSDLVYFRQVERDGVKSRVTVSPLIPSSCLSGSGSQQQGLNGWPSGESEFDPRQKPASYITSVV